jgi:hypothetical protein
MIIFFMWAEVECHTVQSSMLVLLQSKCRDNRVYISSGTGLMISDNLYEII